MADLATNNNKMICPRCGVEMNHHCDKVVYTTDPEEAGGRDPSLGGFIEEIHTCPKCGVAASRHGIE
jgi:ribosomal protein S27AE